MKIRTKINITFTATAIISFLILGYLVESYSIAETKKTINSYLHSSARARAEHLITLIKAQKNTAKNLAASAVFRDLLLGPTSGQTFNNNKEKVYQRLVRTLGADDSMIEIFLLDSKGKIVVSSDTKQDGIDKSTDHYFTEATSSVYLKDPYISEAINKYVYAISAPIVSDSGIFLGVSVIRYSPQSFYNIVLNENGLGNTEENFIINSGKFLITPTRFLDETNVLKTKIDTENAIECFDKSETDYVNKNGYTGLNNQPGHAHVMEAKDYRNVDVIATHMYIPDENWCLIVKVDKADALKAEYALITNFWLYILISVIIFITIVIVFINKIIKSIFAFVDATKKYIIGDKNFRIDVKSKDEVGQLSESFNNMADEVAKSQAEINSKVEEQTKAIVENDKELEKQRTAILNILDDIKEEKNKADVLAKIVEGSDQAILSKDLKGIILTWNHGAEKLYGYKAEEIVGKSIETIVPKDKIDELHQLMDKIISGERPEHIQTKRIKKDGSILDISLTASPIIGINGEVTSISTMAIDISKEKEIDKAKTEFVSLASHQLRTPLSTINWYAEMILDGDVGAVSEEQKKYLNEIYAANKRMVDLVNALLNVSKMDLGTFIIEPEPVSLQEVVKNVLSELQQKIVSKKIVVKEDIENLPKINLDLKLTHIIFQNLLSNAVKYTKDSGEVRISIKSIVDRVDGFNFDKGILIQIKDNGMGIPEGEKGKMFTKLFRADNAKEKESEGTGLGLYLAKSIIENSGGKIWFESRENVGTTFYVVIPFDGMKKKVGEKPLV